MAVKKKKYLGFSIGEKTGLEELTNKGFAETNIVLGSTKSYSFKVYARGEDRVMIKTTLKKKPEHTIYLVYKAGGEKYVNEERTH